MGLSKDQVREHIESVSKRLTSDVEQKLRGYEFAKLSYQVKDYDRAIRYLSGYLELKQKDSRAHLWMGRLYEAVQDHLKAIIHYEIFLELKGEQKDIVLKVAELYLGLENPPVEALKKYAAVASTHPVMYSLKERLTGVAHDYSALLKPQLTSPSPDPAPHIRLVKHYEQLGKTQQAYEFCHLMSQSKGLENNPDWLDCSTTISEKYLRCLAVAGVEGVSVKLDVLITLLWHTSLQFKQQARSLLRTVIASRHTTGRLLQLLLKFDKVLYQACQELKSLSPLESRSFYHVAVRELCGQLYVMASQYLYHTRKDKITSGSLCCEEVLLGDLCLMSSLKATPPRAGAMTVDASIKEWHTRACARQSTVGWQLLMIASVRRKTYFADVVGLYKSKEDYFVLIRSLLKGLSQVMSPLTEPFDLQKSFFAADDTFLQLPKLPVVGDLHLCDEEWMSNGCHDLDSLLWLYLVQKALKQVLPISDWLEKMFPDLPVSVPELSYTNASSLCRCDLEAYFILQCHKYERKLTSAPFTATVPLIEALASPCCLYVEDSDAGKWNEMVNYHRGVSQKFALRRNVQDHLSYVRACAPVRLDMDELLLLARHFKNVCLLQWSTHYWSVLSDLVRSESKLRKRPFGTISKSSKELESIFKEAQLALSHAALQNNDTALALHYFSPVSTPQAAWSQSQEPSQVGTSKESVVDKGPVLDKEVVFPLQKPSEVGTLKKSVVDTAPVLGGEVFFPLQKPSQVGTTKESVVDKGPVLDKEVVFPLQKPSEVGTLKESVIDKGPVIDKEVFFPPSEVGTLKKSVVDTAPVLGGELFFPPQKPSQVRTTKESVVDKRPVLGGEVFFPLQKPPQVGTTKESVVDKRPVLYKEVVFPLHKPSEVGTSKESVVDTAPVLGEEVFFPLQKLSQVGTTKESVVDKGPVFDKEVVFPLQKPSEVGTLKESVVDNGPVIDKEVFSPPHKPSEVGTLMKSVVDTAPVLGGELFFPPQKPSQVRTTKESMVDKRPVLGGEVFLPLQKPPQVGTTKESVVDKRPVLGGEVFFPLQKPPQVEESVVDKRPVLYKEVVFPLHKPSEVGTSKESVVDTAPVLGEEVFFPLQKPSQVGTTKESVVDKGPVLDKEVVFPLHKPSEVGTLKKSVVDTAPVLGGELFFPPQKPSQVGTSKESVVDKGPVLGGEGNEDVIFLYEELPDPVLLAKAKELLLPPSFYLYKKKPSCSGCRGCDDDTDSRSSRAESNNSSNPKASVPIPVLSAPLLVQSEPHGQGNRFSSTGMMSFTSIAQQDKTDTRSSHADSNNSSNPKANVSIPVSSAPLVVQSKPHGQGNHFSSTGMMSFTSIIAQQDNRDTRSTRADSNNSSNPEANVIPVSSAPLVVQSEPHGQGNHFSSTGMMTFTSLIAHQDKSATSFNKISGFQFQGTGAPLFSSSSNDADASENPEDEPTVYFKPIVTLPDDYTYKSGDDDATVLFEHRCKLFRFNGLLEHWKERGVGDMKVIKRSQTGKVALIMRRDLIFKICCNHYVTGEMKLVPLGNDRTWVWLTHCDYSDEQPKEERLAVRFKSVDVANDFKKVFDKCVSEVLLDQCVHGNETGSKIVSSKSSALADDRTGSEESWECDTCMVNNNAGDTNCITCTAPKPGCNLACPTSSTLIYQTSLVESLKYVASSQKSSIDVRDENA